MKGMSILFILLGIIEAIWGLGQLYGVVLSHHSQFLLTGSFYNPGPYAICAGEITVPGGKTECGNFSIYEPKIPWQNSVCLYCVRRQ